MSGRPWACGSPASPWVNLFASQLAGSVDNADSTQLSAYFMRMFEYGAGAALLLVILSPWLKRWAKPKE